MQLAAASAVRKTGRTAAWGISPGLTVRMAAVAETTSATEIGRRKGRSWAVARDGPVPAI